MLFDIAIFDNSAATPGFFSVGLPKKNGCMIKRIDKKLQPLLYGNCMKIHIKF